MSEVSQLDDAGDGDNLNSQLYRYNFDAVTFNEATREFCVEGRAARCEATPLDVLCVLVRRPNEVVSHDELLQKVWAGRAKSEHVLTSSITRLRNALGPVSAKRIVSVARVGYKFSGPLERRVAGRPPRNRMQLTAGQPVPERDGWRLLRRLGPDRPIEVWLAENSALHLTHVFKFASGGDDFSALKHEYTVCRALLKQLGDRRDYIRVLSCNFKTAPYFIEYEDGGDDLDAWAQGGGRLADCTEPMRIGLFLQIAGAVEAAHSVGVLHKDLKPQNVLIAADAVAGTWRVCLADFGNSRLLEPQRLAQLGITVQGMTVNDPEREQVGGTPMYLAPELLAGQTSTTRSDVYALGVLLYQFLMGDFRRPMTNGWQRDLQDPLLIEDVTAATEGRPADRLSSVGELAARLAALDQRRLNAAQHAREASAAIAAKAKLLQIKQRRPWIAAAVVSLVIGAMISVVQYAQTRHALRRAEDESHRAQTINDFLNIDVLQSADVTRIGTTKSVTLADVLKRASEHARQRFADQPETEASVHRQLGSVYLRLHYISQARDEFLRAIDLLQTRREANDASLLMLRFDYVRCLVGVFMPDKALKSLVDVEKLASAGSHFSDNELGLHAMQARVDVMIDNHQDREALPLAKSLVALTDRIAPNDTESRFESRQKLSQVYIRLADKKAADALIGELERPPFGESNVGPVTYAEIKLQLGRDKIENGHFAEAEKLLVEVRDTMLQVLGPTAVQVGLVESELADLYDSEGRSAEATTSATATVAAFTASLGERHSYTLISKANVCMLYLHTDKAGRALPCFDEILPEISPLAVLKSTVQAVNFSRAQAMTDLGRPAEALNLLQGLSVEQLAYAEWGSRDHQWRLQAEIGLAQVKLGRGKEGRDAMRRALPGLEKAGALSWTLRRYRKALASV